MIPDSNGGFFVNNFLVHCINFILFATKVSIIISISLNTSGRLFFF